MKNQFVYLLFGILLNLSIAKPIIGQELKACDIVSVDQINKLLKLNLLYDKNSIINRNGKFECRFTDPNQPSTYIAIGLLYSKIQFGYDMLEADFKSNKASIAASGKAGGKFTKFSPFSTGGKSSFYMTAEKTDFTPEAFEFKIRKGDFIITVSSQNFSTELLSNKVSEIYKLFEKL